MKHKVRAAPSVDEQVVELDSITGRYPNDGPVADAVALNHVDPNAHAPTCHACGVRDSDFKDWEEYVNSPTHNYEHRPACTKYCDSRMRGMTRAIRHVPGKANRLIERFGDVVTLDYVDMLSELAQEGPGIGGFKYIVSMLDCHRHFRVAEPVASEDHQDTIMALKKFRGRDYIELIYTNGGPSIVSSTKELKISVETSTLGDPQNNGRMERSNGVILAHSRTRLVQAGLPSIF